MDGEVVGSALATLLASDRRTPVVRSDVDLTYLQTDFQSLSAMLSLLAEQASDKRALAGMVPIYRALRGADAIPLTFLSGSPKFFKRTLA